jgi:hypothetical protein
LQNQAHPKWLYTTTVFSSSSFFLLRDIWITQLHGVVLCCVDSCLYVLSSACWRGVSAWTFRRWSVLYLIRFPLKFLLFSN